MAIAPTATTKQSNAAPPSQKKRTRPPRIPPAHSTARARVRLGIAPPPLQPSRSGAANAAAAAARAPKGPKGAVGGRLAVVVLGDLLLRADRPDALHKVLVVHLGAVAAQRQHAGLHADGLELWVVVVAVVAVVAVLWWLWFLLLLLLLVVVLWGTGGSGCCCGGGRGGVLLIEVVGEG